jgi:hypothetical protein
MGQNSAITSSIGDERRAKIAEVLGKARTQISDTIAAKRKAQQDGLDSYLSFLGTASERKKSGVKNLGAALLTQGLSPEDVDPVELATIAKSYGVSVDDIVNEFKSQKQVADAAEAERQAQLRKDMSFNLSEGQARYEFDPATGEYKMIASKAKTYAPTSGSGIGGSVGGTLSPLAQAVRDGSISLKDLTPTQRGQVAGELASSGSRPNAKRVKDTADSVVAAIDNILSSNYAGAVGPLSSRLPTLSGDTADAEAYIDNLRSLLTVDNLPLLQGTGPLSDSDLAVLAGAASPLSNKMSEGAFKKTLEKLKQQATNRSQDASYEEVPSSSAEVEVTDPQGNRFMLPIGELQEALNQGYTTDAIK